MNVFVFFLLLPTLNVPLHIGKYTLAGACTPGWQPLVQIVLTKPKLYDISTFSIDFAWAWQCKKL